MKPEKKQDELKRERPPFTIMENSAIEDSRLTVYDKAVLLILCYHADRANTCWPSYKTIAQETPCSRTIAIKAVKNLIRYGYLKKTVRERPGTKENGSNIYRITWNSSGGGKCGVPPSTPDVLGVVHEVDCNQIQSEPDTKNNEEDTAPGGSQKELSIFKKAQTLMEEIHGENYLNYKKEGQCLKRLIDQVSKKAPEDPWKLLESLILQFAEMKQKDRTARGYWRDMDFSPSKLIANAETILEQLKIRTKEEKISQRDKELIKRLWGSNGKSRSVEKDTAPMTKEIEEWAREKRKSFAEGSKACSNMKAQLNKSFGQRKKQELKAG